MVPLNNRNSKEKLDGPSMLGQIKANLSLCNEVNGTIKQSYLQRCTYNYGINGITWGGVYEIYLFMDICHSVSVNYILWKSVQNRLRVSE